ncbi:hypothetical protein AMJ52_09520 [candidate division TA06 bacterium DG_78]|uniref:DUF5050 domain-containing protein n=1 Tax=candidate division TA06 bacterium DG_78 TaxID=1703772 RepID=A0A0S7Y7R5_UNCT6|nr:MAG: hypothetical protein AMJ52_09520 [candidate division TA06 bacterium DG_78]
MAQKAKSFKFLLLKGPLFLLLGLKLHNKYTLVCKNIVVLGLAGFLLRMPLIGIAIIIFLTLSSHSCKDDDDNNNGVWPDTLPRYTQHCWGPTWSPDGQTIAFGYVPWTKIDEDSFAEIWDSSGIFLIDADGNNKRPFLLAGIASFFSSPDFSPDGQWLVYIGGPAGVNNIHKARIDGDSITPLTSNYYWNRRPKWGPDGKKILFGRAQAPGDSCGLCIMNADGLNAKVVNQANSAEFGDFLPDYRIAFRGWVDGDYGIWITDTIGLNKVRIFDGPAYHGLSCSSDGAKILFCIHDGEKIRDEIWIMNVDGSDTRRLCIDGIDPCWSPCGTKIVYIKFNLCKQAMTHPGYGELWLMNADGSNQHQLTFID